VPDQHYQLVRGVLVEDRLEVAGECFQRERLAVGAVAAPVAPLVEADHPEPVGEEFLLVVPHVGIAEPAVDQDERVAAPQLLSVYPRPVEARDVVAFLPQRLGEHLARLGVFHPAQPFGRDSGYERHHGRQPER